MPRLENCGKNVDEYYNKTQAATSTFDLCKKCAEDNQGNTLKSVSLAPYWEEEPSGILEGDVDHPDYDEEDYCCQICGKKLTSEDN